MTRFDDRSRFLDRALRATTRCRGMAKGASPADPVRMGRFVAVERAHATPRQAARDVSGRIEIVCWPWLASAGEIRLLPSCEIQIPYAPVLCPPRCAPAGTT